MFFRYIRDMKGEGKSISRIEFYKASEFITDEKLEDGSPRYVEATFREWWDTQVAADSKTAWTTSAPEGSFYAEIVDPRDTTKTIMLVASLETGEPEDTSALSGEYAPEGPTSGQTEGGATSAQEGASEGTSEGTDKPADAGTEGTQSTEGAA